MKDLDGVRQTLRDAIADLEGELAQVHAALAALNGDVEHKPIPIPPKDKRPKITVSSGQPFVCETCDRDFKSLQAISVHQARAHGDKKWGGKKKVATLEVVEVETINGMKNPRTALYCTACDFTTADLQANAINKHTFAAHSRMSTPAERRPKAAS